MRALASSTTCTILTTAVIYVPYSVDCCCAHSSPLCLQPKRCNRKRSPENRLHTTEIVHNRCCTMRVYQQVSTVDCSCVLREACVSPRLICFAVFGLLALCIGRLVPALAAFSVPVDVPHKCRHCLQTVYQTYIPVLPLSSPTSRMFVASTVHQICSNTRCACVSKCCRRLGVGPAQSRSC